MSEVIQCKSCGSSNQLPEGRTSMFCAYCGTAIERKILSIENNPQVFPKIISKGKKEKSFKETEWYKEKLRKNQAEINLATSLHYKIIKNIEHYRTNDGYNVIIIYEIKDFLNSFPTTRKETEFAPFEYDYSSYNSELNLDSMQIQSFNDLMLNYSIDEIEELTSLSLNNNKIRDWNGIENFKRLVKLSLKNNHIETFPAHLPKEISEYDSNLAAIKFLDLRGNKIKTIGSHVPVFCAPYEILLADNPLELDSIPAKVRSCHTFKDDGREVCWDLEIVLDEEFKLQFPKPKPHEKPIEPSPPIQAEKQEGKCFIATATMGSYNHPDVLELRIFRDNWILKQRWGNCFVKNYYLYGERIAKTIERNLFLKTICYYLVVKPLVIISRIILK